MKHKYEPDHRLSNDDAARYIEKSPSWLNKKRAHGEGPRYLKIGNSVRYLVKDLDSYVANSARETVDSRKAAA